MPRAWTRWFGVLSACAVLATAPFASSAWAQEDASPDATTPQTTIVSAVQGGLRIHLVGVTTAARPVAVEVAALSGADRGVRWQRLPISDSGVRPLGFRAEVATPRVDGERVTVLARVVDESGEVDPSPAVAELVVDAFPPAVARLEVDGGAPATNRQEVTLRSVVRGAVRMRVALSIGELAFAPWTPFRAETTVAIGPSEGSHLVVAQFADEAGNETDPEQGQMRVVVDRTPPRLEAAEAARGGVELVFDEPVIGPDSLTVLLDGTAVAGRLAAGQRPEVLSVELAGLGSGTEHSLEIAAGSGITDFARNPAEAGATRFVALDLRPPGPPPALVATTQASLVRLEWPGAEDDVGVVAYRIYRSSTPMAERPPGDFAIGVAYERAYIDDSGVSNASYYYAVTALDRAGNESMVSPQVRARVGIIGRYHGESQEGTNICKDCHGAVGAGEREDARAERRRCYGCHDGTGSEYDIQAELGEAPGATTTPVSTHPIADDRLRCTQCHTPHRSSEEAPRLLVVKAPDGSRVQGGARFCLVCHWEVRPGARGASAKRVDPSGFQASSHAALPDASGAGVTCSACHASHSSSEPALLPRSESRLCLGCHAASARRGPLGWDVAGQFSGRSHHSVDGTTTDGLSGATLACSSCHSAHLARRGDPGVSDLSARVIDPATGRPWSGGGSTDFCLRCHRGVDDEASRAAAGVTFPIVDPTRYPLFAGWDKQEFKGAAHATAEGLSEGRRTCELCHQPHGSDNPRTLLAAEDTTAEAGMCLGCHGGSLPGVADVGAALRKRSAHPTLLKGGERPVHRDVEGPVELGYNGGVRDMRHAECQDCHDVHTAKPGRREPGSPLAGPALDGAYGVTVRLWPRALMAGPPQSEFIPIRLALGVSEEWQLCFKCHTNYTTLPPLEVTGTVAARDVAAEFNPNNPSYHSAVLPPKAGKRVAFVPGSGWSAESRMACSDCHGSDETATAAAVGPHGSDNASLLVRPFSERTGLQGTEGDLCFACHDRVVYGGSGESTDASRTGFADGDRNLHGVGQAGRGHRVACVSCHSAVAHGAARRALLVSVEDTAPFRAPTAPGVALTAGMPEPGRWSLESCGHEGACHR